MMTYAEAKSKFDKCLNKDRGYKLAGNTRIQKRGHAFAIRLYDTDIVIIRPDGNYRLNSGGWRTMLTKDRMNSVLPCCIWQQNGVWHIGKDMYEDGMLIGSNGKPFIKTASLDCVLKTRKIVDRRCTKFIKLAIASCACRDIGTLKSHRNMTVPIVANKGYAKKLWQIILESKAETMPKLVNLAVLDRGYGNPEFIWRLIESDCRRGIDSSWIKDSLRSFLRKRKPLMVDQIVNEKLAVA